MKISVEYNDEGQIRNVGIIDIKVEFYDQVFRQSKMIDPKILMNESILDSVFEQLKYIMKNTLKKPIEKTLPEMIERFEELDNLCGQINK
jgi:hypothetical protein